MKKMLRRIIPIVIVVTLFVMSTSTALAESNLVITYNDSHAQFFAYLPDPYTLTSGYAKCMQNLTTESGRWEVPAGEKFSYATFFSGAGMTGIVYVFDSKGNLYLGQQFTTTEDFPSFQIDIPAKSTDDSYQVWVIAQSNLNISTYLGWHYV